jgi:hypothetical protein
LNIEKTTAYEVGNPGPVFEQTQKCGGVKPLNYNGTPQPLIRYKIGEKNISRELDDHLTVSW